MLITITTYQREAALWSVADYRKQLGQLEPDAAAVLNDRLERLEGGGLIGIDDDQREVLVRALLRHPDVCEYPPGCVYDGHIGDLLVAITPPAEPGEYDSEAIAVIGRLYRLVIGNTQLVVECVHVVTGTDPGGQFAHVVPWTAGGRHGGPFPVRSLIVHSWVLTQVDATH